MKSLALAWLALGALALTAAASEAQQVAQVSPGARVRVSLARGKDASRIQYQQIGTVASLSPDTLVLREGSAATLQVIPLDSIQKLEYSRGLRSHSLAGAAMGFVGGAVLGWAVKSNEKVPECQDFPCLDFDKTFAPIGGALVGALGGTLVGAAIGAAIRTERWEVIPMPSWKAGLRPGTGGLALSLSANLHF